MQDISILEIPLATHVETHIFSSSIQEIQLFDKNNISTLEWPDTTDGQYAKSFLEPLVRYGISHFINNIKASIYVLKIDSIILPIIVTEENYNNSWVCSPYSQYISYAKMSVNLIGNKWLEMIIKKFIDGLGYISQYSQFNSVVYVNNWLFSTDLYPEGFNETHGEKIVRFLSKTFPKHAIAFRSLTPLTNAPLMNSLKKLNFQLIASRHVFITDAKNNAIFQTRILKSDLKLWQSSTFEITNESSLSLENYEELLALYTDLYILKHEGYNPQFNTNFINHAIKQKLFHFKILKDNGIIKGVAGYYVRGNVMMCPFFGYDKTSSQSNEIYRLLNTALLLEAKEKKLLFHQSAGAAFYKKIRRAEGCLESMATYTAHLPNRQKMFWNLLRVFINKFAPPLMAKY